MDEHRIKWVQLNSHASKRSAETEYVKNTINLDIIINQKIKKLINLDRK